MFDWATFSPGGFWAVLFAIALLDSAFLVKARQFPYRLCKESEAPADLRISSTPFLILGKELIVSLWAFPFQMFFLSGLDAPSADNKTLFKALRRQSRIEDNSRSLLFLALMTAATLIAGPVFSFIFGLNFAVLLLLPLLYLYSFAAAVILYRRRRNLNLSVSESIKLGAEIILCPITLVNVLKKISLHQKKQTNTWNLVSGRSGRNFADRHRLKQNLEYWGDMEVAA